MTLEIDNLSLSRADGVPLLGPVSLALAPGMRLGLVGESGSGKSLLVRALFGTLPEGVHQTGGSILAFGVPMDRPGPGRDQVRGARLAWIPQDPGEALNPLLTLGDQLSLLPGVHRRESRQKTLTRLGPLLDRLGLPTGRAFLNRFPSEISGGQRQRICLVMALSCDPGLLILDEPTTALDVQAQRAFLDLLLEVQAERNLGFLWVTHDLALAATACDRLLVIYGGFLLETGPTSQLLTSPRHPYTTRLLAAALGRPHQESGFLPAPEDRPLGCPFQPRCRSARKSCETWSPWRASHEFGLRCDHP
ncbi:MAG TPA: ABC transporter ATP-binding protein [Geothrix sp.]|nr:ABC transporter ATP-binding protein [Geothrix sp.]